MQASKVACPKCEASLKSARPLAAGMDVSCPRCGIRFRVPSEDGMASAYAAAPTAGAITTAVSMPATAVTASPPALPAASHVPALPADTPGLSPIWVVLSLIALLGVGGGLVYWCFFTGKSPEEEPLIVDGDPAFKGKR